MLQNFTFLLPVFPSDHCEDCWPLSFWNSLLHRPFPHHSLLSFLSFLWPFSPFLPCWFLSPTLIWTLAFIKISILNPFYYNTYFHWVISFILVANPVLFLEVLLSTCLIDFTNLSFHKNVKFNISVIGLISYSTITCSFIPSSFNVIIFYLVSQFRKLSHIKPLLPSFQMQLITSYWSYLVKVSTFCFFFLEVLILLYQDYAKILLCILSCYDRPSESHLYTAARPIHSHQLFKSVNCFPSCRMNFKLLSFEVSFLA